MKKYFNQLALVTVALVLAQHAKAQDIHFSQFYENSILRNPALTGIFSGDYKAGVNYRNQWGNISVPFQTVLASVESRISVNEEVGDMLSFGVTASYDRAGSISFNSFQVYPALNFNKALEDKHQSYLSAGFTGGYIQRSVDPNKMTFSSQYVGGSYSAENASGENITNTKSTYFDLGAGVSFNSSAGEFNNVNYYLGVAAYHLNRPKVAFNSSEAFMRLNTKWNGSLGVQYQIDNNFGLTMHGNFSKQGTYQEVIAGVLGSWRNVDASLNTTFALYAGVFYRLNDAYIPTVKVDYKSYSFTFSYDVNSSGLKSATNNRGGMEVSIFSRGFLTKGLWAQDKTKCPRFEQMMSPNF